MDFKELHKKYQELLIENNNLKEEIKRIKAGDDAVSDTDEDYVSPLYRGRDDTVVDNPLTGSS